MPTRLQPRRRRLSRRPRAATKAPRPPRRVGSREATAFFRAARSQVAAPRDSGKGRAKGAGSSSARGSNDWGWGSGNAGWGKAWCGAHRGQTKRPWPQSEDYRKPATPPRAVKPRP